MERPDTNGKVWFITGASRGLGIVLTQAVLRAGYFAAVTTRHPELLTGLAREFGERLLILRPALRERCEVVDAVRAAAERFGGVDVVVNNAASAVFSPAEDLSEEDLRTQIEVDFLAAAYVSQAVLPVFRLRGSGRILQVSSIATRRPGAGLAGYAAAKWALTGFSLALAAEVEPFNVKVTLVEPGGMRTTMTQQTPARPVGADHVETVGREMARLRARAGQEPIDPVRVAHVILALADEAEPPLRLVLGTDALTAAMAVQRHQLASDDAWAAVSRSVDFPAAEGPAPRRVK